MAITEESRYQLFQRLEERLGHEEAVTMMEHLPPVGWAAVATKTDLEHLRQSLDQSLEKRIDDIEQRLDHRITNEISVLRVEMGEKLNRLLVQLIATMTAFITLVLVISRIG